MNDNDKPTHDWTGRRVALPIGPPTLDEREAPLLARIAELERERDEAIAKLAGTTNARLYYDICEQLRTIFDRDSQALSWGRLPWTVGTLVRERADLHANITAALNSLDLALGALARLAGDSAPALTGPTQLRTGVVRAWVERVEGDVRLFRPGPNDALKADRAATCAECRGCMATPDLQRVCSILPDDPSP